MAKKTDADQEQVKKIETATFYQAVGRRKTASARVRLYLAAVDKVKIGNTEYEKGQVVINGRPGNDYFPTEVYQKLFLEPFRTTNTLDRFVISVKVAGGGLGGQLDAVIQGVARALQVIDKEKYRPTLKKHGFMTRDPRAKQRRKAGFAHKARKKKQSPKR
jgi:small subunit ribosomal protein S9